MNRRRFLAASSAALLPALNAWGQQPTGRTAAAIQENDHIQQARAAALDILKPTQSQLEHGLDLHANSLVFDSYGFSPRCALDGDAFAEQVKQGASDLELKDLREEMS